MLYEINRIRNICKDNYSVLNILFVCFLFLFSVVLSHLYWFIPGTILQFGDWGYRYSAYAKDLYLEWGTWSSAFQFGNGNITLFGYPVRGILWSFLANTGLQYEDVLRFGILLPVAILGFISPYIYVWNKTKNYYISGTLAFFYSAIPYFLVTQTTHLPISFVFAVTPLFFVIFEKAFVTKKSEWWILFIILFSLCSAYELRIAYIVSFLLVYFFLILIWQYKLSYFRLKQILIVGFILLLSQAYWLLPTFKTGASDYVAVANRGLFGNQLFDLFHALTITKWNWTGGAVDWTFKLMPVPLYLFIVPIFVLSGYTFLIYHKKERLLSLYYIYLVFIGIILTKQSGEPFKGLYLWLYEKMPGFNLFREASKLYLITAVGYLGLLSLFMHQLLKLKRFVLLIFVSSTLIVVSFVNLTPLLSRNIDATFVPRTIPEDYLKFNKVISYNENKDFYRTLWVPRGSNWVLNGYIRPKVDFVSVLDKELKMYVDKNLPIYPNRYVPRMVNVLEKPYLKETLDYSSIRYIGIPLQDSANNDDFFISYGERENSNIRNWYVSELDKIDWLDKVDIGTRDLIVYENKGYKPYVFSLDNIYFLDSTESLESKYNFINNELENRFSFEAGNKNNKLTFLGNLFENLKESDISDKIYSKIELASQSNRNSFYVNKNKTNLYYSFNSDSQKLNVYQRNGGVLSVNGARMNEDSGIRSMFQGVLSPDHKYYLGFGTQIIPVQDYTENKLGNINQNYSLSIYYTDNHNLISNASFQEGLWSDTVGDCNAYDDNPILGMRLGSEQEDNASILNNTATDDGELVNDGNYLQLEATTHIACTTNSFSVQRNKSYLFNFDYQSPNAKKAGYYLQFNDVNKTVISEKLFLTDADWHTYMKKIIVPDGATSARLFLYAYSTDEETNIINRYDNFSLLELTVEKEVEMGYKPEFEKQTINLQNENAFEYVDPSYSYKNLLQNGSFENGLWQENVGDCHNYDINAELATNLATDASEGKRSLELQAKRHNACVSTATSVGENNDYLLSFDYKSTNAKKAGYYLQFNDENNTTVKEVLDIKTEGWQKFERKIKAPLGATSVQLYVYAYESDKETNNIVIYDNFKLIELPDLEDRYYLVSDPQLNLKNPEKVDFEIIDPTKKIVHIKGASTSFFLAMSESYHPQWQLEMNNGKIQGWFNSWIPFVRPDKISDDNHLKLNDFLNAWYVDIDEICKNNNQCTQNPDGTYDMEMVIEFFPQRWFYLGLLISGVTLAGCIGYLGYDWRKRRRKKKVVSLAAYQEREAEA